MTTNEPLAVLTFRIADQHYALPIPVVVEVTAMVALITPPESTPVIVGIANRHGEALPMLDLRRVFGSESVQIDASTLFVVAQHEETQVGLIVDEVERVDYLPENALKHTAGNYIRGIISHKSKLIQLIALQPLLEAYLPDEARGQEILKVNVDE